MRGPGAPGAYCEGTVTSVTDTPLPAATDDTGEVPAGVARSWSGATGGDTLLGTTTHE